MSPLAEAEEAFERARRHRGCSTCRAYVRRARVRLILAALAMLVSAAIVVATLYVLVLALIAGYSAIFPAPLADIQLPTL